MSSVPKTFESEMNPHELRIFMVKLEAFAESLTPQERALLLQVLTRADSENYEDVEAHANRPLSLGAAALALYEQR